MELHKSRSEKPPCFYSTSLTNQYLLQHYVPGALQTGLLVSEVLNCYGSPTCTKPDGAEWVRGCQAKVKWMIRANQPDQVSIFIHGNHGHCFKPDLRILRPSHETKKLIRDNSEAIPEAA